MMAVSVTTYHRDNHNVRPMLVSDNLKKPTTDLLLVSSNEHQNDNKLDDNCNKRKKSSKKQRHHHHHHHHHHHQHHYNHRKKNHIFSSRTIAIEQTYVHDVYATIAQEQPDLQIMSPVGSYVRQFLNEFDPGSILLDVGCGDGQYIDLCPHVVLVGLERCSQWFQYHKNYQQRHCEDNNQKKCLLVGNVLYLPFRDEFFDGILCCSVLHHLSTLERRVKALREIARIMKIGARILLTVASNGYCSDITDSKNKDLIRSQDVLIKVDNLRDFQNYFHSNRSSLSATDVDDCVRLRHKHNLSVDGGSIGGDNYSSNSSNSDLENCYSFFKKAIKRFSLASSQLYPFRTSFEEPQQRSTQPRQLPPISISSSLYGKIFNTIDDDYCYPIELRNLDDNDGGGDVHSCPSTSSKSSFDSALSRSSFNRSCGSGCSSQFMTSANQQPQPIQSILAVIKDHLISWKTSLANSFEQWQSFEIKDSEENFNIKKDLIFCNDQNENDHRFSLPIWKSSVPVDNNNIESSADSLAATVTTKNKFKNKIYASNGFETKKQRMLSTQVLPTQDGQLSDANRGIDLSEKLQNQVDPSDFNDNNQIMMHEEDNLLADIIIKSEDKQAMKSSTKNILINKDSNNNNSRILLQKSFSESESSQNSGHCSQYKLLAYYSMPELNTLVAAVFAEKNDRRGSDSNVDNWKNVQKGLVISKPILDDDCNKNEIILDVQQQQQLSPSPETATEDATTTTAEADTYSSSAVTNDFPMKDSTTATPAGVQKPKAIDVSKFTKKLLRQRSFSADYQPEKVKIPPDPPRRFSASPNIETHRYNKCEHIPHNQQISMDSEESFVTIIPAPNNHNYNQLSMINDGINNNLNNYDESFTNNLTDFDMEDVADDDEDDCTANQLVSPNEIYSSCCYTYSCSSDDEDEVACCESLEKDDDRINENNNNTSNDTSISSVLEATIKSISSKCSSNNNNDDDDQDSMNNSSHYGDENDDEITTISSIEESSPEDNDNDDNHQTDHRQQPSQSSNVLHQYYHLFRSGELEQIIEEHVQNLHVIESFYNEYAMSWCIVAEKIHVWTI